MKAHLPIRFLFGSAILGLVVVGPAYARGPGQKANGAAFHSNANRAEQRQEQNPRAASPRIMQAQPHLEQWMENHRDMTLPDQQRALENEPGFHDLPPQVQQRTRNELIRLYNMNPQQRTRVLDRNEALERLSPAQRQMWRGAVEQLNGYPIPRRRLIARAILDLRVMPPEQRQQVIDSPNFATQFSDGERATIRTLLTAEPYPPVGAR
jgi:hypothetical protein